MTTVTIDHVVYHSPEFEKWESETTGYKIFPVMDTSDYGMSFAVVINDPEVATAFKLRFPTL